MKTWYHCCLIQDCQNESRNESNILPVVVNPSSDHVAYSCYLNIQLFNSFLKSKSSWPSIPQSFQTKLSVSDIWNLFTYHWQTCKNYERKRKLYRVTEILKTVRENLCPSYVCCSTESNWEIFNNFYICTCYIFIVSLIFNHQIITRKTSLY